MKSNPVMSLNKQDDDIIRSDRTDFVSTRHFKQSETNSKMKHVVDQSIVFNLQIIFLIFSSLLIGHLTSAEDHRIRSLYQPKRTDSLLQQQRSFDDIECVMVWVCWTKKKKLDRVRVNEWKKKMIVHHMIVKKIWWKFFVRRNHPHHLQH